MALLCGIVSGFIGGGGVVIFLLNHWRRWSIVQMVALMVLMHSINSNLICVSDFIVSYW